MATIPTKPPPKGKTRGHGLAFNDGPAQQAKSPQEMRISDMLERNLALALAKPENKPAEPVKEPKNCLRKEHFMGIPVEWPFPTMLRPQRQMAFSMLRALNSRKHVVLESPTGTGKSAAILCSVLAWQNHMKAKADESSEPIKIFYCSRTHSQVAQMISQVQKTSYRPNMAVLGSRERMCIHQHLPKNANRNTECRCRVKETEGQRKKMQKDQSIRYSDDNPPIHVGSDDYETATKEDDKEVEPTCGHYRQLSTTRTAEHVVARFRSNPNQEKKNGIHDIEDLVSFGRNPYQRGHAFSVDSVQDGAVCPYYVSRALERHAELVLCPYNYILDPHIRASLNIVLDNTVVVLDEAHNVEDTLRSSGSGQWSEMDLYHIVLGLRTYANAPKHYGKKSGFGRGEPEEPPLNEVAHKLLLFIEMIVLDLIGCKKQFENNGGADKALNEWERFHTPDSTEFEIRYDGPNGATQKAVGCQPYFARLYPANSPDPNELRQYSAQISEHVQGTDDFRSAQVKTFENMEELISKLSHAMEHPQHYFVQTVAKPNGSFEFCSGTVLRDSDKRRPTSMPKSGGSNACIQCNSVAGAHELVIQNNRIHHGLYCQGATPSWESFLNLELLSPEPFMKDLVDSCHSVILASGSLAPLPSLCAELGLHPERSTTTTPAMKQSGGAMASPMAQKQLPSGRLQDKPPSLEADHVVDLEKQLCAVAIGHMTNGNPLTVSYNQYKHDSFLDKLGDAIATVIESVPHGGVLVFLPSYSLLKRCIRLWKNPSAENRHQPSSWYRFQMSKGTVIVEPTSGGQSTFEEARHEYAETIRNTGNCLLFAVFRGKMSEGISFNDDNARAVLCIGIPYPSSQARSIKAKKSYNDEQRRCEKRTDLLSGGGWYSQQAYRAIAQALGRCIRHAGDYGAIFLMDSRFCDLSPCDETGLCMNHSRLPKWMRTHVRTLTQQVLHEPNSKVIGGGWDGLKTHLQAFFQQAPTHGANVLHEQQEQLKLARQQASTSAKRESKIKPPKDEANIQKKRRSESVSPVPVQPGRSGPTREQVPSSQPTVFDMFQRDLGEVTQTPPPNKSSKVTPKETNAPKDVIDLMTP